MLAACTPSSVADAETKPDTDWASKPQTQILARDHREFLALVDGVYDNQEQIYFEDNLGFDQSDRHARSTLTISTEDTGTISFPDAKLSFERRIVRIKLSDGPDTNYNPFRLSQHGTEWKVGNCTVTFTRAFDQFIGRGNENCAQTQMVWSPQGLSITKAPEGLSDGVFRRAKYFICWVSPQKTDGSYAFYNDVILHDQGGRAWLEGEDHDRVGLKMRNVVWAAGNNRPSLVLYAYRGDDEDTAISYAWTSPDEPRIGINLRWMQASCTQGDDTITPGINLKTGSGN